MAIHYGITQCHLYLSGLKHFEVITDHQPLKTVFKKKDLHEIDNEKLMKIKQDLQSQYVFTVEYRKGPSHIVPDALSRNPVNDPEKGNDDGIEFGKISAITSCHGIKDLSLENLEKEATKDKRYAKLHLAVRNGFSEFKAKYGAWTKAPQNRYVVEFRPHWQDLATH